MAGVPEGRVAQPPVRQHVASGSPGYLLGPNHVKTIVTLVGQYVPQEKGPLVSSLVQFSFEKQE